MVRDSAYRNSEQEEFALKHGVAFVALCVSGIRAQDVRCIYYF